MPLRYNQAQRRNYLTNRIVLSSARTGVDWMLRDRFGRPLYALLGICAAILSIACLNLAGLLAARTLARQKEVGIRLAIGGTRWRVMRPLVLEILLLALAGGIGGVLFASWASRLMVAAASTMYSDFSVDASLSVRALAWLAGAVAVVAAALAVVPVWQARRSADVGNLREAGRGIVGSSGRAQKVMIAMQIAFTLALVTAGGVFASSFAKLHNLPLGLRPEGIAEGMLSPLPGGYNLENPAPYYASLQQKIESLPGVQSASLSSFALYWQKLFPELVRAGDSSRELRAQTIRITDGYFQTIGVNLRAGEDFTRDHTEPEAIVSESVARLLGAGVLGGDVLVGEAGAAKRYRVVGVAPTIRISMEDVREPSPLAVYLNFWQDSKEQRYPVLFVKGANGKPPDAKALALAVQSLSREYLDEYRPLGQQRDEAIVEDRLLAYLSGVFGLLALVLAAIGLFAILSFYVASRTNEIGVRMALGANTAQIHGLVLGQIGPVVVAGIVAGVVLALGAGRMLASFTYGAAPHNPLLLAAGVLSLVVTALGAALSPARRAASIPPLDALRHD